LVSDAERAQRLRVLLAKVQTNAALSVPGRPAPKKLTAWPTDDTFTSFPDSEYPSVAPRAATEDEREFAASAMERRYQSEDRWTSLLTTALEPPEAPATSHLREVIRPVAAPQEEALEEQPAAPTEEPEMPATSFASVVPEKLPEPPAIPAAPDSGSGRLRDEPQPSEPPMSALARAITKAAKERAIELGRSDEIWGDVLDNLRERRPTSRPDGQLPTQPPVSTAAPIRTDVSALRGEKPFPKAIVPQIDVGAEADGRSGPPSRRPKHRMRVLSGKQRAPERPSTTSRYVGWGLVAASVAAVAVASVVFVPKWLDARTAPTNKSEVADPPPQASSAPSAISTAETSAALPPASASHPGFPTDPNTPPADAAELPSNYGYVYFLSERPLHVYVNGRLAGETGQWLKVECDYRNVRFSERAVPKLGGPFPIWAGEWHTIVVPCRAATKFDAVAH
jgi:hypothetical protein